jgi:hypothetical protein
MMQRKVVLADDLVVIIIKLFRMVDDVPSGSESICAEAAARSETIVNVLSNPCMIIGGVSFTKNM